MTLHIPKVLSVDGIEHQRIPLVFDSPHSGTDYPEDFAHAVNPFQLRHAEDTHVHELWSGAVSAGAVLLQAHFPRAYIDTNRAADDMDPAQIEGYFPRPLNPSIKSRLGIGLCWTREPPAGGPLYDRKLTATEIIHRLDTYHQPYQQQLRVLLDSAHTRWGSVWHVNCHSMQEFASAMSTQERGTARPDFVLGDRDGTSCSPDMTEAVRSFLVAKGFSVAVNDPYKGMELIRANGDPSKHRHSMQIEVNRKLYMNEETREPNDGFNALQSTFSELSNHLAAFVTEQLEGTYP